MRYNSTVAPRGLTPHKLDIIELVAAGLKNIEIGRQLGTTRKTVALQVRTCYDITGMSNRVELALWWQSRHPDAAPRETLKEGQ
jgi:DNA-binding NarL/FixJ family response regulator